MVSKTFQRNKVFSWSLNFETSQENGDWFIYYYDPNGVDMYKVKLDAATLTMAKALRTQITAWMNGIDTWSGTVVESWKKQVVQHPASDVEEWVQQ
jgi:hypothetical protein